MPILAMSSSTTMGRYGEYFDAALLPGASAALTKSFTADSLMALVDRLLPVSGRHDDMATQFGRLRAVGAPAIREVMSRSGVNN